MRTYRLELLALVALIITQTVAAMETNSTMGTNSTIGAAIPCVATPTAAECAEFKYSEDMLRKDLDSLCADMPFMVACSLDKRCQATANKTSVGKQPDTCDLMSLVATTCKLDGMGKMKGCANYNAMCATGSKVPQCSAPGLAHLPTTRSSGSLSKDLCAQMPEMSGCSSCTWDKTWPCADPLSVYGRICFEMPSHRECNSWKEVCEGPSAKDPSLFICSLQKDTNSSAATGATAIAAVASPSPSPAAAKSGAAGTRPSHVLAAAAGLAGVGLLVALS